MAFAAASLGDTTDHLNTVEAFASMRPRPGRSEAWCGASARACDSCHSESNVCHAATARFSSIVLIDRPSLRNAWESARCGSENESEGVLASQSVETDVFHVRGAHRENGAEASRTQYCSRCGGVDN